MIQTPSEATLKKYGLTEPEWRAILEKQGGVCAVCMNPPPGKAHYRDSQILCAGCHMRAIRRKHAVKVEEERQTVLETGLVACAKCGIEKQLDEYPQTRKNRKGQPRYAYCKICHSEVQRALRLKKLFNISIEDYDRILAGQNGVCAICRQPPKNRRLAVDHCHKTGLVRGLLCAFCNRAIALFRDDLARFESTIVYLRVPPASEALGAPRYGLKGRVTNKAKTRNRLNRDVFERPKQKSE